MSQSLITVLIPCKDECANIVDCVASAKLIADEILVADSGSTDETVQLVQGMEDCRLIQGEWSGYAGFKNWAIPQASHPWVLIIDADERVTPDLADEIRKNLAAGTDDVDGFRVGFRTFFIGHELRYCSWNNRAVRLIRRDVCRYSDRLVHESFAVERSRLRDLENPLDHFTIRNYDHYFEKYLLYTRLSARQMHNEGRRATAWHLLCRPMLRFLYLYIARGGFLEGRIGIQVCVLRSFFNTFLKQARLWELEEFEAHESGPQVSSAEDQEPRVIEAQPTQLSTGSKAA